MKIEGVVHHAGAGAVGLDDGRWAGSLLLRPWRADGGALMKTSFYVRLAARKTSGVAMKDGSKFEVGQVLAFEVSDHEPAGKYSYARGVLSGRTRTIDAADLKKKARELDRPLRVVDERLGRLMRATGEESFTGKITALGRRVPLTINESQKVRGEAVVAEAAKAIAAVDFDALPAIVVKKMFTLAKRWNEGPISREQFARVLRFAEVSTYVGGQVDVAFDSGEVFTDHRVKASLTNGKVRSVSLE